MVIPLLANQDLTPMLCNATEETFVMDQSADLFTKNN